MKLDSEYFCASQRNVRGIFVILDIEPGERREIKKY